MYAATKGAIIISFLQAATATTANPLRAMIRTRARMATRMRRIGNGPYCSILSLSEMYNPFLSWITNKSKGPFRRTQPPTTFQLQGAPLAMENLTPRWRTRGTSPYPRTTTNECLTEG